MPVPGPQQQALTGLRDLRRPMAWPRSLERAPCCADRVGVWEVDKFAGGARAHGVLSCLRNTGKLGARGPPGIASQAPSAGPRRR